MSHDSFQHSANDGALLFFLDFFFLVPPKSGYNCVAIFAECVQIFRSSLPGLGTISVLFHYMGLSIHSLSSSSPGQVTRHAQQPCDQGISKTGGRVVTFQTTSLLYCIYPIRTEPCPVIRWFLQKCDRISGCHPDRWVESGSSGHQTQSPPTA